MKKEEENDCTTECTAVGKREERNTCVLHPFNVTQDWSDFPDQLCAPFSFQIGERDSIHFKGKERECCIIFRPFPICLCYQRDTEGEDEVFKKIPLERTPIFVSVVCVWVIWNFLSSSYLISKIGGRVVVGVCSFLLLLLVFCEKGKKELPQFLMMRQARDVCRISHMRQTTCSLSMDRKEKTVCLLAHQTRLPIRSQTLTNNSYFSYRIFYLQDIDQKGKWRKTKQK